MRELFRKYLDNNCSPAEVRRLLAYFKISENEVILRRLITEWLEENKEDEEENQWQSNFSNALRFIKKQLSIDTVNLFVNFRKTEFQVSTEPSSIHHSFSLLLTIHTTQFIIIETNIKALTIFSLTNKY